MLERAYLDNARSGEGLERLQNEVTRLLDCFLEAGAIKVDPGSLIPAEVLLDLYGEDIRARAFLVAGADGEQVLRPDFTVPVIQRHMAVGAEPARYCYSGSVWCRQDQGDDREQEYLQVGFELLDGYAPESADAEVFSLITRALEGWDLDVATGDLGLLLAAIDSISTTQQRRDALRRHVWRPARFQRLLQRYSSPPQYKSDLLAAARAGNVEEVIEKAGPEIGLRSRQDVEDRIARLLKDADTPPLTSSEVDLIEAVLDLRGTTGDALTSLRYLAADSPAMGPSVERFAARLDALDRLGIPADTLHFEGTYGRTTLEYYDGFVFGFFSRENADLPLIASGGRYDALTRVLGDGKGIPAVGSIIRPEALLVLEETKP